MTGGAAATHPAARALEISIVLTEDPPVVRFVVLADGRRTAQVDVPAETVGVPADLGRLRLQVAEPRFHLPPAALEELRRALHEPSRPADEPIWLSLRRPWGHLPAVPWERLLQAALGVPLIRAPFPSLPPVATPDQLRVVVCASSSGTSKAFALADLVDEVVDQLSRVAERVRMDVFTDAASFPDVVRTLDRHRDPRTVRVHDPRALAGRERPAPGTTPGSELADPWLAWVSDVVGPDGIDVLHIIAPGHVSSDYGGVVLPALPASARNTDAQRVLGAADLAMFQRLTGAWLLGLTVARPGMNGVGLRLLAHRTAQQWAGPVVLYDPYVDPTQGTELSTMYPWLLRRATGAPRTPALTVYCHRSSSVTPAEGERTRGATWAQPPLYVRELLQDLTLARGRTLDLIHGVNAAPAWVTANQRALERAAAPLLERGSVEPTTSAQQALRRGIEDALKLVSAALERHAGAPPGRT